MTVGQLRLILAGLPDSAHVVHSLDEEGNAYRPAEAQVEKALWRRGEWEVKHPGDVAPGDEDVLVIWPGWER